MTAGVSDFRKSELEKHEKQGNYLSKEKSSSVTVVAVDCHVIASEDGAVHYYPWWLKNDTR